MDDKDDRSPKTVDQVVEMLIEELDEDVLIKVRDSESVSEFHFGLGMYIRNKYIYKNENREELENSVFSRHEDPDGKPNFQDIYFRHPDDASSIILEELQKRLREMDERN